MSNRQKDEEVASTKTISDPLVGVISDLEDRSGVLEQMLRKLNYELWELDPDRQTIKFDQTPTHLINFGDSVTMSITSFLTYIHPGDRSKTKKAFKQILEEKEDPDSVDFRILPRISARGKEQWIRIEGVNSEHNKPCILVAVKDVTQFKLIQSERENLLTEAREANQDKEHFMEAVTHELRTPLNAIMGYLGLLNDGIHENLNDQQQYWLERAIDNTDKLNGYLTQVVFFFQLLSGKVRIELYDFSLHFQPLREKFEHEAEEKGIELIFLSNPSLPLHANHEEVTQILHRLIDNALRFTPAGGRIIVASECIGDRAIISVTDTGCGIPADQMERIFKRYAQIYSPFQHHNPGFGLGLAFSKIYAARMNGTLAVESEVGKGSTFTLTIPCNPHSE